MTHAAATVERDSALDFGHQPWDVAAAGWNQHGDLIHEWLKPVTQTMLDDARIGLGSRVLDVAAGAGDQTLDIARRVGTGGWVLATDVSPAILADHRERRAAPSQAAVFGRAYASSLTYSVTRY